MVVDVDDELPDPTGLLDQPLGPLRVRAVREHHDVDRAFQHGERAIALDAGQKGEERGRGMRTTVGYGPAPSFER